MKRNIQVIKYFTFLLFLYGIGCIYFAQSAFASSLALKNLLKNIPQQGFTVVASLPHNTHYFTEGLVTDDDFLFEGTGSYGESRLYQIEKKTGRVLRQVSLPAQFFGEGITVMGNKIYQLTWKEQKGFIYDKNHLTLLQTFSYHGEGWGLTHDDHSLIMSNGSATLSFINPHTLKIERTLVVRANHIPVDSLNELEYIRGKIYANVWPTSIIVIISPVTGKIEGWLDLQALSPLKRNPFDLVANGIAFNKKDGTLLVTGKNWPRLFVIRQTPPC